MRKVVLYGAAALSTICLALCAVWLVLFSICLIGTGGTYSRTYPDGSIACGIPVFTRESFWPPFQLFGVPIVLAIASWRTIAYCREQLKLVH